MRIKNRQAFWTDRVCQIANVGNQSVGQANREGKLLEGADGAAALLSETCQYAGGQRQGKKRSLFQKKSGEVTCNRPRLFRLGMRFSGPTPSFQRPKIQQ